MATELSLNEIKENMINWALNLLGKEEYIGWCLSFVEDAIEQSNDIEIFGGDSAKESYLLYSDSSYEGVPEKGSVVFYDCLCETKEGFMDWGHCGIALDDGKIIHAWDRVRIDNYLDIEKLSSGGNHPKYLGAVPLSRILEQKP